MFLALKEMKDAKLRYSLLTAIIGLIAFVIFIIGGLAGGLANGHTQAIGDWDSSAIVLNENANKIVNASSLKASEADNVDAKEKAAVGLYSGAVKHDGETENISFFGTKKGSFVVPTLTSGKQYSANYEITISQNMADKLDLKVGDKIKVGNLAHKLKITGIFAKTQFSIQPVAYTNLQTFIALKYGTTVSDSQVESIPVNLIAVKGTTLKNVELTDSKTTPLEKMSVDTFKSNLPGVTPEKITLNAMVYVLIVISAGIVAIFMYVLTLQKKNLFGVLKAQGIPTRVITNSIFAQSLMMGLLGVLVAFALASLFGMLAPAGMPFLATYQTWLLHGLLIIVVATVGSIFSLPTVLKADPVESIGG